MGKNYGHHHCRYCLKQCLFLTEALHWTKKNVVDKTVEGDNVVFDFEAKKGCSLCDHGCCFCYSEEDFLSKTSCTVVLGKTAGNHTRLSSCRKGPLARGGKGQRRLLLSAASVLLLLLMLLCLLLCSAVVCILQTHLPAGGPGLSCNKAASNDFTVLPGGFAFKKTSWCQKVPVVQECGSLFCSKMFTLKKCLMHIIL